MTTFERRAAWVLGTAIAIARALTMAASPWDWDEMLFLLGLRHYDIPFHHPHPPGFPLFIGAAHLFEWIGFSDFHALQAVNFVGAALLFPVALFAFREMRFPTRTAFGAALLLVFFPNVWFYGGSGLSDVPALTLSLAGVGLLLRGRRSDAALVGGAVLLAVAIGFRPQTALVGVVPAIHAMRRPKATFAALLSAAAVILAAYNVAAALTGGWERYLEAVRIHQQYITGIDSFLNPGRPPLLHLLDEFFIKPYHAPLVILLAAAGLIRAIVRRTPALVLLTTFGLLAIVSWLTLDVQSAGRFAIAYAPLVAGAAAEGIAFIAMRHTRAEAAIAGILAAAMIVWTAPAALRVRSHVSPTVSAMRWIARNIDARSSWLYVHETMLPFAHYYLPHYRGRWVHDRFPLSAIRLRTGYFVTEGERRDAIARFAWPHGRVWAIARHRYFAVSVSRMAPRFEFVTGWYGEESNATSSWRWMGRRGVVRVTGDGEPGRLSIALEVPLELLPEPPEITVRWNGMPLDRLRPAARNVERTYEVAGDGELMINTTATVNLEREHRGADTRDLGVKLRELRWSAPAPRGGEGPYPSSGLRPPSPR